MKRFVVAVLGVLLSFAAAAENRPLLVVSEVIQIKAEPAKVWNFLKRFDGLRTGTHCSLEARSFPAATVSSEPSG